jgi:hypothetical protein
MKNKTFTIPTNQLDEESLKICIRMCNIQINTVKGEKLLEKCLKTREKINHDGVVKIFVKPFVPDEINNEVLKIKSKAIHCNNFSEVNLNKVIGGYLYAIMIDSINYEGLSVLESYYVDAWLSAYVEAAWKAVESILINESKKDFTSEGYEEKRYLSECYAPGFEGMAMETIEDIFGIMNLSEYGMGLQAGYTLLPRHSIIGMYFIYI